MRSATVMLTETDSMKDPQRPSALGEPFRGFWGGDMRYALCDEPKAKSESRSSVVLFTSDHMGEREKNFLLKAALTLLLLPTEKEQEALLLSQRREFVSFNKRKKSLMGLLNTRLFESGIRCSTQCLPCAQQSQAFLLWSP